MMFGQRSFIVAAAVLAIAALLLGLAAFAGELRIGEPLRANLAIAGAVLALLAGPLLFTMAHRHFAGLHLLQSALLGIARQPGRVLADVAPAQLETGLQGLWQQIALLSQRHSPDGRLTRQLTSILAVLPQPVVVVTQSGLVTLANRPALDLFDTHRLDPGTSIFDVADRASFASLIAIAQSDEPTTAQLETIDGATYDARARVLPDGGAVIVLDASAHGEAGLVHALELHDAPPPRVAPMPDTPLDALTIMVMDCETTGLDAGSDRLLSLAAVRVQGDRLLRAETVDVLVNPRAAIPAQATAIHGITDAMVADARPLATLWPEIELLLRDCVIVGHNIGFDLTLLENELRRAGLTWRRPPSLCTVQLAAALDRSLSDLNLEALAKLYGIAVTGRHTALGDALVTAEVYLHLLALMRAKGDRTLADAQRRAQSARRVIARQKEAGW